MQSNRHQRLDGAQNVSVKWAKKIDLAWCQLLQRGCLLSTSLKVYRKISNLRYKKVKRRLFLLYLVFLSPVSSVSLTPIRRRSLELQNRNAYRNTSLDAWIAFLQTWKKAAKSILKQQEELVTVNLIQIGEGPLFLWMDTQFMKTIPISYPRKCHDPSKCKGSIVRYAGLSPKL